jgi:hypothetical protein
VSVVQRVSDTIKPRLSMETRTRINKARFSSRAPSASLRLLPDLLVIGAMRSGTSSLFKYLSGHPELAPSLRKEVEFFTRNHGRSEEWYRQHFPLRARRTAARAAGRDLLAFEATPYYLFDPRAAARARALLPDAKVVAVLRDPVDRAYSDYQHMRRHGFEKLSFADALAAEPERTGAELARMGADPTYFSKDHHHFSYFERGRYGPQLQRWLAHYPPTQVLLLESADLYEQPARLLHEVEDFLGVRRWVPPRFRNYSYVGEPPPRARVDEDLRAVLRERYAADDDLLATLWGRTPSWRRDG